MIRILSNFLTIIRSGTRKCAKLVLAFSVLWASYAGQNASANADFYQIYPAYLYNIIRFVHWPDTQFTAANQPINFCLYGEPFLEEPLNAFLKNKKLAEHPFTVLRIEEFNNGSDCHVLFVGSLIRGAVEQELALASGRHILSIAHREDFILQGGMVNFYIDNKKLRFEVGVDNIAKAGLVVEHLLLGISKVIHTQN